MVVMAKSRFSSLDAGLECTLASNCLSPWRFAQDGSVHDVAAMAAAMAKAYCVGYLPLSLLPIKSH